MGTYFLFGKEVSFSDAADRYFYLKKSFGSAVENASTLFKIFYEKAGSISNVLDDYMTTVANITQECAIDPLYATLVRGFIIMCNLVGSFSLYLGRGFRLHKLDK